MGASRVAIVLRGQQPQNSQVSLLDTEHGRLDGYHKKMVLSSGALITYMLERRGSACFFNYVKIEDLPLMHARHDILFVHHILELCHQFLPIGSCARGVFDLLRFLYSTERDEWSMAKKNFFLFKLLTTIGFYPHDAAASSADIMSIVRLPFTSFEEIDESTMLHDAISDWLRRCIAEHPRIEQFNTAHFLTQERV